MRGEGNVGVEGQDGRIFLLSNDTINATNKDNFYAEIFQRGIKEKKSTNNKYIE